jgi:hemerythrin-like domain-containing protein
MDSKQRVDVFVNVHKGLRRGLLGLSLRIGNLDWSDAEEVKAAGAEFATLLHFLREHAENEDQVQVPFLEQKAPGTTRKMRDDHERIEKELDRLERDWENISKNEDPAEAGYRFYLAYNRFLSEYLAHMDLEEREITEAVYRHFTDEEIGLEFKKIIARTSPQDMGMMLGYMIPGMNHSERSVFLSNLKMAAPPEVFGKVKGLAQKVLAPKDWEKLSVRLG